MPKETRTKLYRARFQGRRLTAPLRPLPGILILGAMKSGTTSLYFYLAQHPSILPGYQKEVEYFSLHYRHGVDYYRAHYPVRIGGPKRVGIDGSPYYLFHPAAPARAAKVVPDAKLLVILRDPVERAMSHYFHSLRVHSEPLSFEDALHAEEGRLAGEREKLLADPAYLSPAWRHHGYVARGRYAEQIERWLEYYRRDQLLVLDLADLEGDLDRTYAETLDFLGLPPYVPGSRERKNLGGKDASAMSDEARTFLTDAFRPENERLEKLLGRRFSWFD